MNDQDRSLSAALADLADAMPDDPFRVDALHARIDRNRRRRRVGHAVVGVSVIGLTVVGVGLLRPGRPSVSTVPATQPSAAPTGQTATTPSLPACASIPPPHTPPTGDGSGKDAAIAAKVAAAATGAAGTAPESAFEGVKGFGKVVATTESSITIALLEPVAGQPAEVTATFTGESLYYDGDAVLSARPAPSPGDQVGFAVAQRAPGAYDVLLLQVHPLITGSGGDGDSKVTDGQKAAGTPDEAQTGASKNVAEVVSAQDGSLTLKVRGGPLAGQTITAALAADVVYQVGDQECVDPALAPGDVIAVVMEQGADGASSIDRIALFAS